MSFIDNIKQTVTGIDYDFDAESNQGDSSSAGLVSWATKKEENQFTDNSAISYDNSVSTSNVDASQTSYVYAPTISLNSNGVTGASTSTTSSPETTTTLKKEATTSADATPSFTSSESSGLNLTAIGIAVAIAGAGAIALNPKILTGGKK